MHTTTYSLSVTKKMTAQAERPGEMLGGHSASASTATQQTSAAGQLKGPRLQAYLALWEIIVRTLCCYWPVNNTALPW